jgi:hypothetical protein
MRCASQRSRSRSRQLDTANVSLMASRCRGAVCSDKTRPSRLDRAEPGHAAQASFFSMSGWCISD